MAVATKIGDLTTTYVGDVIEVLDRLPEESVHCCATSPPFYGLRSYLPSEHPDKAKEIGAESLPVEYVEKLVDVFRSVRRVLRADGTLWLNLGDSYARNGGTKGGGNRELLHLEGVQRRMTSVPKGSGLKAKDLIGIPWQVATALRDDGWYLRSAAPWVKRNAMPSSVTDRPSSSVEYVFLLAKSENYFYDAEAVRKPSVRQSSGNKKRKKGDQYDRPGCQLGQGVPWSGTSRNRRDGDWWFESVGMLLAEDEEVIGFDVPVKSYKGAHFACWPPSLVRPMILAGTSEKGCCGVCGCSWQRVIEKERVATRPGQDVKYLPKSDGDQATAEAMDWNRPNVIGNRDPKRHVTLTKTIGWQRYCDHAEADVVPCTVLDPFGGSGCTAMVANELGRRCTLIDLNGDYTKLQQERVTGAA